VDGAGSAGGQLLASQPAAEISKHLEREAVDAHVGGHQVEHAPHDIDGLGVGQALVLLPGPAELDQPGAVSAEAEGTAPSPVERVSLVATSVEPEGSVPHVRRRGVDRQGASA
jgi:hypothetical protein